MNIKGLNYSLFVCIFFSFLSLAETLPVNIIIIEDTCNFKNKTPSVYAVSLCITDIKSGKSTLYIYPTEVDIYPEKLKLIESSEGQHGGDRDGEHGGDRGGDRGGDQSGGSGTPQSSKPNNNNNNGMNNVQSANDSVLEFNLKNSGYELAPKIMQSLTSTFKINDSLQRGVLLYKSLENNNSMANVGSWEQFTTKYNNNSIENSGYALKSGFVMEPIIQLGSEVAWGTMVDSPVITAIVSIGVTNPLTGSIIAVGYFAYVRPTSISILSSTGTSSFVILSSSIEQNINAVNQQVEVLQRTPERDLVEFLMNYFISK